MSKIIAAIFKPIAGIFEKMDDLMWQGWLCHPDRFDSRLDEYSRSRKDIEGIKWSRKRFEADFVVVDMAREVGQDVLDRIAADISMRMEDGLVDFMFRCQETELAHFRLLGGQRTTDPSIRIFLGRPNVVSSSDVRTRRG